MEGLILQLFTVFSPIIADIIKRRREQTGQDPTDAEINEEFRNNLAKYLGEGAAWKATHPKK